MKDIVVEVAEGRLRGEPDSGSLAFRGIPYAAAPQGELRWRRPEPAAAWAGIRDATRFGPIAPQNGASKSATTSEDCLYLNVWTPALDAARRPVLVWVHGGGLTSGSGSTRMLNGARLALRGDVVVVTLNYRLGALGTLYAPDELGAESSNVALHDQAAALRWVRRNAAAFGGDPRNLTVMGQSSGAVSIACLLATPALHGLCDKAILQSGGLERVHTREAAREFTRRFMDALPRDATGEFGDLRKLPLESILAAQRAVIAKQRMIPPEGIYHPTIDGTTPPLHPVDAARAGMTDAVPLLIGTTADEWRAMDMDLPDAVFDAQLLAERVAALLGPQARAQDVIALYRAGQARAGRATHDRAVAAALVSDFHFRAPGEGFARGHAAHGHPAWQYVLEWSSPDARLDAYHGICTPLVFGTYEAAPSVGKGEVLRRVSQTVQDAWIAFARSGDPSTPALGSWPRFAAAERFTLRLGERPQLARGYRSEELALWPRAH